MTLSRNGSAAMNAWLIIFAWMSVGLAAESAAVGDQQTSPSSPASTDTHRSLSAIQIDVRAALRAEASSRRRGRNTSEVIRLVDLYREMAAHPKRDSSLMLKQLGLRLRSRLQKVSDHINGQSSRAKRDAKKDLPGSRNFRTGPTTPCSRRCCACWRRSTSSGPGHPRWIRLRSQSR
jgi:hypothetical protein